ncbi:MAG: hypothetical protein DIZ79_14995 [endosymbiont of Lamellibrachia luymesi]|uniref:Uncharacterized protein n=1 Tax=endosymbiont of Lamellibrachia luymesi TaxID=2200907 RepID=A0A370DSI7_9GAMM|nr:MAG: hypothetical protein DIZ79_14995 [endosymbiont of Lamellibrachia luymesi]
MDNYLDKRRPQGTQILLLLSDSGDPEDKEPAINGWLWDELWSSDPATSFRRKMFGLILLLGAVFMTGCSSTGSSSVGGSVSYGAYYGGYYDPYPINYQSDKFRETRFNIITIMHIDNYQYLQFIGKIFREADR